MLFVLPIDQCNHFFLIATGFTLSQGIATPSLSPHVVHWSCWNLYSFVYWVYICIYHYSIQEENWAAIVKLQALQVQNDCRTYEWSDYKLCECGSNYKLYGWEVAIGSMSA